MSHSGENAATGIGSEDVTADEGEKLDDETNISEILDEQIPVSMVACLWRAKLIFYKL